MKAPLPRPRTMTASGRRQQSEDSKAPAHADSPAPIEPDFIVSSLRDPVAIERPPDEAGEYGEEDEVQVTRPRTEADRTEGQYRDRRQAGEAHEGRADRAEHEPAITPHGSPPPAPRPQTLRTRT